MVEQPDFFAAPDAIELSSERLWQVLEHWQQQGWIRALDLALVRMLAQLDPAAAPELLLAVALTSHQLGRGHICLDLEATLADPDAALSLPPEGAFGELLPDRPSELFSALTLARWLERIESSVLVAPGEGAAPLVLERGLETELERREPTRLYLRRQWQYEVSVAASIRTRLESNDTQALPEGMAERLDRLFERPASASVDWQRLACALAGTSRFAIITGGPGTGKTTTVVRLLALLQSQALAVGKRLRIRLAAPTGKAAARLTESIGRAVSQLPEAMSEHIPTEVTTLHRLLGSRPDSRHFRHHADNPLHADLVVVDEASMIDLEMMHALLSALPARTQLILLGDKDQLASVEAGAVLGDLCLDAEQGGYSIATLDKVSAAGAGDVAQWQQSGGVPGDQPLAQHIVMLRHSHRFGEHSGIGRLARGVNGGDLRAVERVFSESPDELEWLEPRSDRAESLRALLLDGGRLGRERAAPGYRAYLDRLRGARPATGDYRDDAWQQWAGELLESFTQFRVLCALRKGPWGVEGVNRLAEQVLAEAQMLEPDQLWYDGRPVMMTRNDYSLGLMNGDIGLCLRVPRSNIEDGKRDEVLRVVFPLAEGGLKWVLPSRLQSSETVFAMTVHKSQGSEFAHTALVLPPGPNPVLTRELVYTGITRASGWFTLVSPARVRLHEAIATRVHRASALRSRIVGECIPGKCIARD